MRQSIPTASKSRKSQIHLINLAIFPTVFTLQKITSPESMDVYGKGKGGQYEALVPRRFIPIGSTNQLRFSIRDFIDRSKLDLGVVMNKRPSPFTMPKDEAVTTAVELPTGIPVPEKEVVAPTSIPILSDIEKNKVNDDGETKPATRDRSKEKE